MLSVRNIFGTEEPFTDFKGLRRSRKVNGATVTSLTVIDSDANRDAYDLIEEESSIFFDDDEYIIKVMSIKSVGKRSIKQIEAVQKFYVDLINKQQHEIHNGSITFHDYNALVFEDTGYNFEVIDQFFARSFENLGEESRLSLLQKGLDRFQAEMELIGNTVRLRHRIGNDTDFQFRYGHNIKTLERKVDTKNLATVIRGKGDPELGISAYYRSDNADIFGEIDAPTINDERFKSEASLLEEMISRLQDVPEFSITIDFIDLRAAGYPYTVPNEGDSVFVIYEPMNNLKIETRILEIEEEFDVNLNPIRTTVTLANHKKSFAGTMFDNVQKQLDGFLTDDGNIKYNALDNAVKVATEALHSARTELEFNNGIIAREVDNPNNLVVYNSKGLGISSDGGHTFREAITSDGFVLSAGVIGRLGANHIEIGPGTQFSEGFSPDEVKQSVVDEIGDVDAIIGGFEEYIDGAFKDGVIEEAEAIAIEKYINSVQTEKEDVDERYSAVYENTFLEGFPKTNLLNTKVNYNGAHNELINAIQTAIADGKTSEQEKADVNAKFGEYRDALSLLSLRLEQAIDFISQAKANAAEERAKKHADDNDGDLRDNLNLTAPLPTAIRMNDTGITAWTPNDEGYARLDYRGLYIAGGAIQIDGGLPDSEIENAGKWNGQGTYIDEEGVYTGTLTANQITSGRIDSEHIQIGSDTAFEDGYDPSEIDVSTRNLILNSRGNSVEDWRIWGSVSNVSLTQSRYIGEDWIWVRNVSDSNRTIGVHTPRFKMKANKDYFVGFIFRSRSNSGYTLDYNYLRDGAPGESLETIKGLSSVHMGGFEGSISGDGARVWFKVSHDEDLENARILIAITDRSPNAGFVLREFMVAETNQEVPWLPAPEEQVKLVEDTDAKVRQDLRLEAPLPTAIRMDSTGITARTSNSNNYARLDHRGLYVQGGAIQISGGLPDSQIENAEHWTNQGTYIDQNGIYTGKINAQQVQVGFNDVSNSVRITSSGLETYDGSERTSLLDRIGHRFYDGGVYTGQIGVSNIVNEPERRGLRFLASQDASWLAWAKDVGTGVADNLMTWFADGSSSSMGFNFFDTTRFRERVYIDKRLYAKSGVYFDDNGSSFISKIGTNLEIKHADNTASINLHNNGAISFSSYGNQTHAFFANGTKTGGSIEIDGTRYGMSPIDSPQVLIEYIEFDVELSQFGTKIMLDETYLKSVTNFAVFLNNGELVSKGKDHVIVKGEGAADIRFVGERIEHKDVMWADMHTEEDVEVIEHEPEPAPRLSVGRA